MKTSTMAVIKDLIVRYPQLGSIEESIRTAVEILIKSYSNGHKLLVCGNGGSASDALHIVGELMKDFVMPRKLQVELREKIMNAAGDDAEYILSSLQGALPTIALVSEIALETAYANDRTPDLSFAQQVLGYGNEGDVLFGISTSGNSKNVIYAAEVAMAKGVKVITLTGATGGKIKDHCDCLINVPEKETYKIQELHLPVYHTICLALENEFYGDK